jgi:hypothetical protein
MSLCSKKCGQLRVREMTLKYDEAVHIEKGREVGNTLSPAFVFSWLKDDCVNEDVVKRVRVQASERVWDSWGVKWNDDQAVKAAFRSRRDAYIEQAAKAEDTGRDYRIFEMPEG